MIMKSPIQPWEDIAICEEAPEDVTEQGVVVNMNSMYDEKQKPEKGVIVAVGKSSDEKKSLPIPLKEGDLIFYERYTSNKIPHMGKQYNFVRFKHIVGVIPA